MVFDFLKLDSEELFLSYHHIFFSFSPNNHPYVDEIVYAIITCEYYE